ncbi:hypothetical protein [Marinobacter algicola]|uniref:Succinyl-CoA synthetase, beta subunit n=1 Tax=Marinobacter algicola DG893 TaxID=443152 RepID=A6EX63_9GAMM|nr:hypothetical protein [Marinobacter algicola]EDM48751.1 Succinyl-CoA synthetase, beta subunit [Marinobacter algicola DG893]
MALNLPMYRPARNAQIFRYLAFAGMILIAPLFFVGGPGWSDGPLFKSAWNLGHILFFALSTLAIQPWRIWTGWSLWGIGTLAVLVLGTGIELLQHGTSRQMDWQDILRNQVGVWTILAVRPRASLTRQVWPLRLIVTALLVAEIGATARIAIQQYRVSQLLPTLYDFRQPDPSPFWDGVIEPVTDHAINTHNRALRISLSTARYSGVSLHNLPEDWRDYDRLVINLYNPQDHPLPMILRINDMEHDLGDNDYNDRFNTRLPLAPGPNQFELDLDRIRTAPKGRSMNMQAIRRLILFTVALPEPKTLYLRDIRLE